MGISFLLAISTLVVGVEMQSETDLEVNPADPNGPPFEQLNEIIVERTKSSTSKKLKPVEYLRRFCFEPNRLTGQSAPPVNSIDWDPLSPLALKQFGVFDEAVQAFGLFDPDRNHTLLIKFERFEHNGKLTENRCTLAVIGGEEHESFLRDMSAMFRGAGTQRHTGHRDGVNKVQGWRQFLWTGMPSRGSKNWQSINSKTRGGQRSTWVVVANPSFYEQYEYIAGELKINNDDNTPIAVLSFSHTKAKK